MKDIRSKINYLFNKYIFVFFIVIGLCPMLAVSYATFSINTQGYRSNEMYISELLYSIKIDNENTYTIDIEPGRKEHTIEITSLNAISTNYKLAYLNNSDLEVVYASDYLEPSFGGITTTRTISLMITNNSSETKTLSLMVFGGYGFNNVDNIEVLNTYTEIKLDYYHYDYETTALYVDNVLVDKLDEEKDYTLESYTCTNGSEVEYDTSGKRLIITGGSKTKCSLYFKDGGYTPIKYSQIAENYSCANTSAGSDPVFTYTGNCTIVNEGNDNWKVKFLTDGTLKFNKTANIDAFLVGGGAGGGISSEHYTGGGGGGGGYTKTVKNIFISKTSGTYSIVIGAGGASNAQGGITAAFNTSVNGGSTGSAPNGGAGGSGGGAGGLDLARAATQGGQDGGNGVNASWNGNAASGGKGQGTTTREFGESGGELYASGGSGGCGKQNIGTLGTSVAGISAGAGRGAGNGYSANGYDATANTGSGGGGAASTSTGGKGGSGIVIIRNTR